VTQHDLQRNFTFSLNGCACGFKNTNRVLIEPQAFSKSKEYQMTESKETNGRTLNKGEKSKVSGNSQEERLLTTA
jgi:hypothetical protein